MAVTSTIDLNAALVGTGLLGQVAARPALAHPRSVAISNNGDDSDDDEIAYVTEYFAAAARPLASEASEAPPCGRWIRSKVLSVAPPRLRVSFVGRGTAAA
jgi:hypothetical protein